MRKLFFALATSPPAIVMCFSDLDSIPSFPPGDGVFVNHVGPSPTPVSDTGDVPTIHQATDDRLFISFDIPEFDADVSDFIGSSGSTNAGASTYTGHLEREVKSLTMKNQDLAAQLMSLRMANLRLQQDNHHLSKNLEHYIEGLLSKVYHLEMSVEHLTSESRRLENEGARAAVKCIATEARLEEARKSLSKHAKDNAYLRSTNSYLQERCTAFKLIYEKKYEQPDDTIGDDSGSSADGEYEIDSNVVPGE